MRIRSSLLLVLLISSLNACTGKIGDTSIVEDNTEVNGIVFKGPMNAGSTVEMQPMTEGGAAEGDAVDSTVSDAAGEYTLTIPHTGLVRLIAQGVTMDEAHGEEGSEPLSLYAYGVVGPDAPELHVNVFTDLTHVRVETLLAEGMSPEDAIAQAQDELIKALPIGLGEPPGDDGYVLNPYGDGLAQSVLFADSAVLAQAGKDMEDAGTGSLSKVMDDLRADLADDGAINADLASLIFDAEAHLDPDLARFALQSRIEDAGMDYTIPDLNPALDSDHDEVPNTLDNCRYVANEYQTDTLGLGFGDDCDYRLRSIGTTEHWGCGVLETDGSLACWEVDAPPTGGSPPLPDVFPAHPNAPWGEVVFLTGAYGHIAVGDNIICATPEGGGDLHCWVSGASEEATYAGDYTTVRAAGGVVCAIDSAGALLCVDNAGDDPITSAGPYADVAIFGNGAICTVDQDGGALAWVGDTTGLPTLPTATYGFVRIAASTTSWGCAIASDGSLSCFGDTPAALAAPTTGAWKDVAVGDGVGCATDSDDNLTCWRDETVCPEVEEAPTTLTNLAAADCQVCGTDENGLGRCWPRYWEQEHPSP